MPMGEIAQRWLTVDQAAAYTGYATATLYHKVCRREVPFVKKHGRLRFDRLRLDEWMLEDAVDCVDDF